MEAFCLSTAARPLPIPRRPAPRSGEPRGCAELSPATRGEDGSLAGERKGARPGGQRRRPPRNPEQRRGGLDPPADKSARMSRRLSRRRAESVRRQGAGGERWAGFPACVATPRSAPQPGGENRVNSCPAEPFRRWSRGTRKPPPLRWLLLRHRPLKCLLNAGIRCFLISGARIRLLCLLRDVAVTRASYIKQGGKKYLYFNYIFPASRAK